MESEIWVPLAGYHKAKKLYLPARVVVQGQCTIPFSGRRQSSDVNTSLDATFGAEAHKPRRRAASRGRIILLGSGPLAKGNLGGPPR